MGTCKFFWVNILLLAGSLLLDRPESLAASYKLTIAYTADNAVPSCTVVLDDVCIFIGNKYSDWTYPETVTSTVDLTPGKSYSIIWEVQNYYGTPEPTNNPTGFIGQFKIGGGGWQLSSGNNSDWSVRQTLDGDDVIVSYGTNASSFWYDYIGRKVDSISDDAQWIGPGEFPGSTDHYYVIATFTAPSPGVATAVAMLLGDSSPSALALRLPLDGYTPYTAPVSSVFDHSGKTDYSDTDHRVEAFNGEVGTVGPWPGTTCYAKEGGGDFGSGFNYTGVTGLGGKKYLCYNSHPGIDYSVADGTPVYSAAQGTVTGTGRDSCFGRYVKIDHGGGYVTKYFHLESVDASVVAIGRHIDAGIQMGASGHDGTCSTGPHLHFQVELNGTPVDPYGYLGQKILWQ